MGRFMPGVLGGILAASASLAWAAEDPVAAAPLSPTLNRAAPLERLGFGSCLHQERPQPIFSAINARAWDAFLMIGDNVYGDATPPALDELAEAYALAAQAKGLNTLRASTPVLATWDDHDYGANDAGAEFPGKAKAEELFHRFWHTPADSVLRQREGLYYHENLGPEDQRVQLIFLDTRSFRTGLVPTDAINAPGKERYIPTEAPEQSVLGDAQWAWLSARLQEPAALRIVVSSIQVLAEGHGWEAWRLFPRERTRVLELLGASAAPVVIFSGDRHRGGLYQYSLGLDRRLVELTSSSLNLAIPGIQEEPGPLRIGPTYRDENFGAVLLDWEQRQFELALFDRDGLALTSYHGALMDNGE
jgi:alkaline phosphatase D